MTVEAAAVPSAGRNSAADASLAASAAATSTTDTASSVLATPATCAGSATAGSASTASTIGPRASSGAPGPSGGRDECPPRDTVAACRVAVPATRPGRPPGTSEACDLSRLGVRGESPVLAVPASRLRADRGVLVAPVPSLRARDERAVFAFADRTRGTLCALGSRTTSLASAPTAGVSTAILSATGDVASRGCLPPSPPPRSSPPLPPSTDAAMSTAAAWASSDVGRGAPSSRTSAGAVPTGGPAASGSADRSSRPAGPLVASLVASACGAASATARGLGASARGNVTSNKGAAAWDNDGVRADGDGSAACTAIGDASPHATSTPPTASGGGHAPPVTGESDGTATTTVGANKTAAAPSTGLTTFPPSASPRAPDGRDTPATVAARGVDVLRTRDRADALMALEEPPASTEAVSTTTPLVLAAAPAAVPLSADRPAGIVRPPTPLPLSVVVPPLADRTRNSANRFLLRSLASLAPPAPGHQVTGGGYHLGQRCRRHGRHQCRLFRHRVLQVVEAAWHPQRQPP